MTNEQFADELIKQFTGIWPSLRATMCPDEVFQYQVQMVKALAENSLNTPEAIQRGFKLARSEGGQYLPSVPQFVKWCRPEKKASNNYYIALPPQEITSEEREKFMGMSKNMLELIK